MLRRLARFWTPLRVLDAAVLLGIIFVVLWSLHPNLLFSSSLITGGDTGSHLALPAYLKTQGNLFDLTPWYPGWFAGMPAYTYYFVLPDVLATLASYVIGFAVAFKLATVLGSVLMPLCAYAMGRLFRAPRPIPLALALATLPFLFDASFTIDGGNLFSTMAGEYAFSLSLALAMLTIGLFARGLRSGRGYWLCAIALSLTLASHILPWFFTLASIVVLVVFELLARRGMGDPHDPVLVQGDYARPLRFAAGAGVISLALSAWWLAPFLTSQNLTNSMGYVNDDVSHLHAIFTTLGWFTSNGAAAGDRWVIVLAAVGVLTAFIVRSRLGMLLSTMTVLSLLAFTYDPQSAIWNERLVPFWFLTIHLMAGWLFGYVASLWVHRRESDIDYELVEASFDELELELAHEVPSDVSGERASVAVALDDKEFHASEFLEARRSERRITRALSATVLVAALGFGSTVPGLIPSVASFLHLNTTGNQVTNWAQWNYSGYQAKPAWPEYHNLMLTMSRVASKYGCGRAMWEYNANENRFGTPEALMLLPYWTNNCVDSMEGLLFESSATTPYHFLDQAELSAAPSDPQVGLNYGSLNVYRGVQHLQMLGVKYYMAFSPSVIAQASSDPALQLVATTRAWPSPGVQWRIYRIKNSPVVQPLTSLPNVINNISGRLTWLNANETWWLNAKYWRTPIAESGPSSWPRATSVTSLRNVPITTKVTVTKVIQGTQSLSFHVDKIGVPVEVKISYFNRWRVSGANGPYRISPNLMVVVPTSHHVTLVYGSTTALRAGNIVSDVATLCGFVVLYFSLRKRQKLRK
jgi:hypothetical protein